MVLRTALALAFVAAGAAAAPVGKVARPAADARNLEGVWTNASLTILQRPKAFKALVATPYEAAAYEAARRDRYVRGIAPSDPAAGAPDAGPVEDESAQWGSSPPGLARIRGEIRTSWIVDPPDGRLPYTEAARASADTALKNEEVYDDPEGRPFDERCLLGGGGGIAAPILNRDLIKVVQTRDAVVLMGEQNHETRVIRLGGRHPPPSVRTWIGDSIGHWEGATLVVETTNLSPSDGWRWNAGDWIRLSPATRIVERFTRTGPDEILYAYTVEDPASYTRPWRGEMPLRATSQPLLEFACHEGNYSLTNILAGARAQERGAAASATLRAQP